MFFRQKILIWKHQLKKGNIHKSKPQRDKLIFFSKEALIILSKFLHNAIRGGGVGVAQTAE